MSLITELKAAAEKATLKNELKQAYKYQHMGIKDSDHHAVSWDGRYRLVDNCREDLCDDVVKTWEFFIAVQPHLPKLITALETAREGLEWMSKNRAMTVFIEDETHVAHFFEKCDQTLSEMNEVMK